MARLGFVILLSMAGSVPGWAESTMMIQPHWKSCNFKGTCYALDAQDAATSAFSEKFFFRNAHFHIYDLRKNKKLSKEILVERGFFNDTGETVYLVNSRSGDYVFNADTGVLLKVP